MKRAVKAVILGSVTGVLGVLASMIPGVLELEENAGLDWLFTLRGPRTPPAEVVVVSIDKHSADALGLPAEPGKWPRSYHAELVNRLVAAGATVIVLDVFFKEPRNPQGDAALATALDAASRVVLFAYTRKEITRIYDEAGNPSGEMLTQRLVPPVAQIAESASALAPFPLPVFPIKVSQFWTFTPGTGDLPTLPVVALQLYASPLTSDLQDLVDHLIAVPAPPRAPAGNDRPAALTGTLQTLRATFRNSPALVKRLVDALSGELQGRFTREQRILLQALIKMHDEPDSRYLNFYGPPQTVTTVPYIQVLQPERPLLPGQKPVDLNGKAVFVGYSERLQPEQLDEFYTVFSQKNGLSLSGVEITATAFANLLEDFPVTPLTLPAHYLLLLCWGLLAGIVCRLLPVIPAVIGTVCLGGLYMVASYTLFRETATWVPLVVPLFLQAPLALFSAVLWHYLEVHRERENIRTAFGLYLPPPVVDRLASDMADGKAESQLLHGTCLYTDAEHYTTLSEGMEPEALAGLMNAYYETLFLPVRKHNGIISDVVGDSMMAIWATPTAEPDVRKQAIEAALEIDGEITRLEQQNAPHHLPTRIGLHSGQILLGSIGAIDHYEYRAVGDIVNTASRIQGLNKILGTRVLLSQDVLEGIDRFLTREVGTFLLAGKTRSLVLHELIGYREDAMAPDRALRHSLFVEGLAAFRQADWKRAIEVFTRLTKTPEGDGLSHYYLGLCIHHQKQPPASDWEGVIRLNTK
jgi:adenylate cyclase